MHQSLSTARTLSSICIPQSCSPTDNDDFTIPLNLSSNISHTQQSHRSLNFNKEIESFGWKEARRRAEESIGRKLSTRYFPLELTTLDNSLANKRNLNIQTTSSCTMSFMNTEDEHGCKRASHLHKFQSETISPGPISLRSEWKVPYLVRRSTVAAPRFIRGTRGVTGNGWIARYCNLVKFRPGTFSSWPEIADALP